MTIPKRKLEVSIFPFEVHIRYVSISIINFTVKISGDFLKRRLKIPKSYSDLDSLMTYLKNYRMMTSYIKLIPAIPLPVKVRGVLYVKKEHKSQLESFLLEEFWEDCLRIGDFGKSFSSDEIKSLLLKFPYPMIVDSFEVEKTSASFDYFCFPCFINFEENIPSSMIEIRDLEEFKGVKEDKRRIFVPSIVEPREFTGLPLEIPESQETSKKE